MANISSIWQQLEQVKGELSLHAHLMSMELRDEWQLLQARFAKLEIELVENAKRLGEAEEAFFVGDADEIERLLAKFRELQQKQQG